MKNGNQLVVPYFDRHSLKQTRHLTTIELEQEDVGNGMELCDVLEAFRPHPTNIETLSFTSYAGASLPKWMYKLHFSSLWLLHMEGMNRLSRIVGITLNFLLHLHILDCPKLSEVLIAAPSLIHVKVRNCPELHCLSLDPCLGSSTEEWLIASALRNYRFVVDVVDSNRWERMDSPILCRCSLWKVVRVSNPFQGQCSILFSLGPSTLKNLLN